MRRRTVPFILALFFIVPLWPMIVSAGDSAEESSPEAPRIILFTDDRWYIVSMLEEKNGSYIYSKPGGYPIALGEYEFEKARTLEINQALQELVAACRGESYELSRIFKLTGRSKRIFGEVVQRKLQPCYQKVRNQYQEARRRAAKAQEKKTLSDIADEVDIEDEVEGPDTVISNENVGAGDAAFSDFGEDFGTGHAHDAEYELKARSVAEEECSKEWGTNERELQYCVATEMEAVERLMTRPVTLVPTNIFGGIRGECRRRWRRDYSKRDRCEVDEIRYYWALEDLMTGTGLPEEAVRGFKATCSTKWPRSYKMQTSCIEERVGALQSTPE